MRRNYWIVCLLLLCADAWSGSLDEVLRQVQAFRAQETRIDEERKAHFLADKNQQQRLLNETKAALAKAEAENKALRTQFTDNDARIKQLGQQLKAQSGEMGTLFSKAREFATTFKMEVDSSLISAQFPERPLVLEQLIVANETPTLSQLENMWIGVLQEMTESAKVSRFRHRVTDADGQQRDEDVYRIGSFSAVANGQYLRYVSAMDRLETLQRQPDSDYLKLARNLTESHDDFVEIAVDPTRGVVLEQINKAPEGYAWVPKSLQDVLTNGVDVAILGVLLLASLWALSVAIERWMFYRRIDLRAYSSKTVLETELTRHLTVIGTVAANAPYVGLLGTVLGIMMTFHKMGTTEKGMDVHHIMIGLSTALKATAIGLMVAIPCVVMNNILRRRIRELVTAYGEVMRGS